MGIMAELDKGGFVHRDVNRVDGKTLGEAIACCDLINQEPCDRNEELYSAAPGGKFNLTMGSQDARYKEFDLDRETGCIRSVEHAYSTDGGLAVLYGNIAENGCIVKTAGVAENVLQFEGPAKVFDSQDDAVDAILEKKVKAGDVVVIRYEGPRGGPGMQERLAPTSYIMGQGLGETIDLCAELPVAGCMCIPEIHTRRLPAPSRRCS